MTTAAKAKTLIGLYEAPEILRVVNVWDVVSARAVAKLPETKAIATAGHGIAASFGFEDGTISRDIMIDMVGRIAASVSVPVTADLDDGYGDAGETTRLAIGAGVVGANIEDRLKPFDESVAAVEAIVKAAEAEGVPFALNARTDAFVRAATALSRKASRMRSSAAGRSSTPEPPRCSCRECSTPTSPASSSRVSAKASSA